MRSILFDAYAWIEYLEGSKEGEMARDFLEDQETEVYTSTLTIAELSDAFHKSGVDTELNWGEIQDFIQLNSRLVTLDAEEMAEAGALKVRKREKFRDFGLIDAIILESSRKIGAKLLTADPHLIGENNALPLG